MSSAVIAALATAIPAILGAVTALVVALRSHSASSATASMLAAHVAKPEPPGSYSTDGVQPPAT